MERGQQDVEHREADRRGAGGGFKAGAEPARLGHPAPHALVALVLLTCTWAWWGWKQGAYFGTVFLPGLVLLAAGVALLARTAPWDARLALSTPVMLALGGLVGLAAWTLTSALWSPAPDVAIADAQRVLGYALAFGLGAWLCNLLGSRMRLAAAPIAIAAAIVGAAAVTTLLVGHDLGSYLEVDGTLQFPLGYRNANAAFFLIALWPTLGFAAGRGDWRLRGLALGSATMCVELAILSESRGSVIAAAVAAVTYLCLATNRARALVWLLLAIAPALVVIPFASHLFEASSHGDPLLSPLREAAKAVAISSTMAVVIGAWAARSERWLPSSPRFALAANRIATRGLLALVVASLLGFLIAVGNPIDWIGPRVAEFRSGHNPAFTNQSTRFRFNAATGRSDLWRVALLDARDHPILGDGAGGYHYSYLLHRHRTTTVHDAHSVELETLSELGIPGLALLLIALGGGATAAWRARRLGPGPASLSAIALTAFAYWLAHTSLDWFWPYPALTAPVFALLGAACAPALRAPHAPPRRGRRLCLIAGLAALAISTLPPFLSARYVNAAYAEWRDDLPGAYDDLDRAHSLNPLSDQPLLAQGAIAKAAGDRGRAVDAFSRAAALRPEEWATHYFLALLDRRSAPRVARAELALARARNPLEPELDALAPRLKASRGRGR